MFSGIISAVAKIKKTHQKNGSLFLTIATPRGWQLRPGDSISTNGTCLTVKRVDKNEYVTELMPETLAKTYFNCLKNDKVNLEKSLTLSTPLDGHLVTGHVDCVGKVKKIIKAGQSKLFCISFPKKFSQYVAEKGSIAVDGISLTVVNVGVGWFTVSLVEYTLQNTTMSEKKINDKVHLEFDILAKYIERIIKK